MKVNLITLLLILVFIIPLIKACISGFSSDNLKEDIVSVEGDINFFISMIIGLYLMRKIFVQHQLGIYSNIYNQIPPYIVTYLDTHPQMLYIVVLPLLVIILYQVFKLFPYIINRIVMFPILDSIERRLKGKKGIVNRIIASIFELPRAFCYVILITLIFNGLAFTNVSSGLNNYLTKSYLYNYTCKNILMPVANSKIAKEIPRIINNSFKIEIKENSNDITDSVSLENAKNQKNVVIYYNGITLDEGIKSNNEINNFAKKLVENENSESDKAKKIYDWIGSNLEYDYSKADKILNNDLKQKSGAVIAFNERKGICFDYSCLYVAMCRAVGLNVRLVTGEGFNGMNWVSHAWNQVQINDKWVNVDTTFYKGGNYFNNKQFNVDHRDAEIAGQWQ